ncbi:hypothetical protein [Mycobacterium sp. P7213]|uniref:hypothetical protein n=1 Tax=Mycobacterium sp. P7213 TaxID=2478465 RepID=UPI000F62C9E9|nr:hypothetical protein [Mycobacterium sp. P7213]
MSEDPSPNEFFETVFGLSERSRPSTQYLQLLRRYSAGAEVFTSATPETGRERYEALWIAGGVVGVLATDGYADDSLITGAIRRIETLGFIELGAVFGSVGFNTVASPSIVLTFSEDEIEVEVGAGHYNAEAFISVLLARMARIAV